jgi:hypothetical protein
MDQTTTDRLGRLNMFQIAGAAFVTSTLAAVAVLLLSRRFLVAHPAADGEGATGAFDQPDTPEGMGTNW